MKYKWVLHPEKDVCGNGAIVAEGYFTKLSDYPICVIMSYAKHYRAVIFDLKRTIIDIGYDNVKLTRLNRRLLKKRSKGLITYEQYIKIYLLFVCNMVETS